MNSNDKPLVWLAGEIKTPPFSLAARIEAGLLLRRLQQRELLSLPHSRPMPRELRIGNLRVFYEVPKEEPGSVHILAIGQKRGNTLFISGHQVTL